MAAEDLLKSPSKLIPTESWHAKEHEAGDFCLLGDE